MTTLNRNIMFFLVCAVTYVSSDQSLAGLVITGQQETISSPQDSVAEDIEFFLDLTAPQDGGSVVSGGWQIRVELTGPNAGTDVAITGVGNTVFFTQADTGLGAADLFTTTQAFRGVLSFTDFALNDQGGLMQVNLLVAPGTLGNYALSILTGMDDMQINQAGGATPYDYSTVNGSLSVIPEPSALLLVQVGVGLAVVGGYCRRKSFHSK
jgi:hypothetical protein